MSISFLLNYSILLKFFFWAVMHNLGQEHGAECKCSTHWCTWVLKKPKASHGLSLQAVMHSLGREHAAECKRQCIEPSMVHMGSQKTKSITWVDFAGCNAQPWS